MNYEAPWNDARNAAMRMPRPRFDMLLLAGASHEDVQRLVIESHPQSLT